MSAAVKQYLTCLAPDVDDSARRLSSDCRRDSCCTNDESGSWSYPDVLQEGEVVAGDVWEQKKKGPLPFGREPLTSDLAMFPLPFSKVMSLYRV